MKNSLCDCSEEVISVLRLARSENVGPKTFFELIRLFGDAQTTLEHIAEFSLKGGRQKPIKVCSKNEVVRELLALQKINATVLTYRHINYPKLLLHIADPPPVITCKGNLELLNSRILAVVGSRNASLNGTEFTKKITKDLIDSNITVVSGLARGIDTAAHSAALPHTVAVIAGGIDHIYPQENTALYHKIVEQGLIIAELPLHFPPLSKHFPQRNRIIAGMSYGTLVIEANLKSGSLITARLALEYNRELFAVPGFPYDPRYQGTNLLIKNGACLVEKIDDILHQLPAISINQENSFSQESVNQYKSLNNYKSLTVSEEDRDLVRKLISSVPVDIEALIKHTELPASVINVIILELELAGKITRCAGNKIVISY